MSIAINSNFERDQKKAAAGQVQFDFSFPVFSENYLTVYLTPNGATPNDVTQKLNLGTDYSVTGVGKEAGGFIVLTAAASAGDVITLVGTEPIERESVFEDYNPFTVALNEQLNQETVMMQQTYTYWNHLTPRYNFSQLISDQVRPFKRILPMLPNGHVWVGRGEINQVPDDITTMFVGSGGIGNVVAAHPAPMKNSFAIWTGNEFQLTDSDIVPDGAQIAPAVGATEEVAGFTDGWGAFHIPNQASNAGDSTPSNGDMYYDTTQNALFAYINGSWQQIATGTGGGGNTFTINQNNHGFINGDWVRIDQGTQKFAKAQATSDELAEVAGVVISHTTNTFVLQTEGLTPNIFAGLTIGGVYFLSDSAPGGLMTLTAPTVLNEVNLPLGISYTATSLFVRQSRGFIIGGVSPTGTYTNTNVIPVHQVGHNLNLGDVVRVNSSSAYVKAFGDTFLHAQAVGVVIAKIDADNFILQTEGFSTNSITQDDQGMPLVAGSAYYLSAAIGKEGLVTSTAPSTVGQGIRPIFICATIGGSTTGFILPEFPTEVTSSGVNPNIVTITQNGHPFNKGDFVYVTTTTPTITYAKAIGTSLAASQVAGCVIATTTNTFTLQTEGYCQNIVTIDENGANLVAGTMYYLSYTVGKEGLITSISPTDPSLFSKPVFDVEQSANVTTTDAGYIVPQRPLSVGATVNSNIVTISQTAHGLDKGDWVYLNTTGAKKYTKAIATTRNTSNVVGVVIKKIDDDTFILQTSGYNIGAVSVDDASAAVVVGVPYYLSSTVAGKIHNSQPAVGLYSELCYIPEQTLAAGGVNAGYILPSQPQLVSSGGGGTGPALQAAVHFSISTTIMNSFNVTSVTAVSSSRRKINFTNSFANSNYYFVGSSGSFSAAASYVYGPDNSQPTTSNFVINISGISSAWHTYALFYA